MNFFKHGIILFGLLLTMQDAMTQERDRTKIEDKYKWNLTDLYPSDAAWEQKKSEFEKRIPEVEAFKGKLAESASQLLQCMETLSNINKEFGRIYSYASMISDQDTRVSKYLGMKSELSQLGTKLSSAASYIEPEILKIEKSTIDKFFAENSGLKIYRQYIDDIIRRKEHTGTEAEEKIIAAAGLIASTADDVYNVFSNADFPDAEVQLTNGQKVKLDKSAFALYRANTNRADRKLVFDAFFNQQGKFERTFGTQLYGEVKKNMFYKTARKYNTSQEAALDVYKIPSGVYSTLVENVNKNLSTFHRYLNLRKQILGVDTLHYYDLYAPLLSNVDLKYSVEEAEKNILASLTPLGKDYISVADKAFKERWIDMYPNEGKRSGAYSNGYAYDVHPYILMNYNGKYNDMSTLTHELGHTMHSYLSNKTQPFPTANYSIFVAEVASTFNEALLIDYMLKNIKDDGQRLSLLGDYLEGIKGTVFRQTQFAEFEIRIHEVAEKGQALTGEKFSELYQEIVRKYYGHDKGVCIVDDEIRYEWSYIPHFYMNFYVYQYATSFTASAALSEKALQGDKEAIKKYLTFLSSGSSKYPVDLLKDAGVDMTTSQPFDLTMQKMNRVMNEIEVILKRMKK
jgi:oligoendopeptidase F